MKEKICGGDDFVVKKTMMICIRNPMDWELRLTKMERGFPGG
jgi:hypothetical protein